jgi:hypothetical protein
VVADFRRHSPADILISSNLPRFRGVLAGTAAAISDAQATEAFKVLYEDLGPMRVVAESVRGLGVTTLWNTTNHACLRHCRRRRRNGAFCHDERDDGSLV